MTEEQEGYKTLATLQDTLVEAADILRADPNAVKVVTQILQLIDTIHTLREANAYTS